MLLIFALCNGRGEKKEQSLLRKLHKRVGGDWLIPEPFGVRKGKRKRDLKRNNTPSGIQIFDHPISLPTKIDIG